MCVKNKIKEDAIYILATSRNFWSWIERRHARIHPSIKIANSIAVRKRDSDKVPVTVLT